MTDVIEFRLILLAIFAASLNHHYSGDIGRPDIKRSRLWKLARSFLIRGRRDRRCRLDRLSLN